MKQPIRSALLFFTIVVVALASASCRVNSAIGTEPVQGGGGSAGGGQGRGSGGSPGSGGGSGAGGAGPTPDAGMPPYGATPPADGRAGSGDGPPAAPATFGAITNVGSDPGAAAVADTGVNVAMSNDGTAFLTYYDATGVWARRYAAGVFDPKTLISQAGTTQNFDPVIVADDQGNAMLAWSAIGDLVSSWGSAVARRFTASGGWPGGWGAIETLRAGTSVTDVQRVIGASMSPRGHAAVLWAGGTSTYFRLFEAGHGWDVTQLLPPDSIGDQFSFDTRIADVGQRARAVIVQDGGSVRARAYDYDLASHAGVMGSPTDLLSAASGFQTVVMSTAIDLGGNVTTGFVQRISPGFEMSSGYVGRYVGGAWQPPAVGLTPALETPQPIVAVSRGGDGIVVWVHCSTIDMPVPCDLHARLLQGGAWQPESTIAAPGVPIEAANAAIDGHGRAIVFWTQTDSSTSQSLLASTIGPSSTWSAPHLIETGPAIVIGGVVSTAVDDDGAGLAAWLEADPPAGSAATFARAVPFHL